MPIKLVLITLSKLFFDFSIAASATINYYVKFWQSFKIFVFRYIKVIIFYFIFFRIEWLYLDPFLDKLSKEQTLNFFFKDKIKFVPTNPQPPVINIFILILNVIHYLCLYPL